MMYESSEALPLTISQQAYWQRCGEALDALEKNRLFTYRICGNVDEDALQAAWQQVIQANDTLRVRFETYPSFRQQVEEDVWAELEYVDLSDLNADEQMSELEWLVIDAAEQPFDLDGAPQIWAALYRLSDCDHILVVVAQPLLLDEDSDETLAKALSNAYERQCLKSGSEEETGQPSLLQSQAEFGQSMSEADLSKALAFWQGWVNRLEGKGGIPLDTPVEQYGMAQAARLAIPIDPACWRQVESVATSLETSTERLLQTAWFILMHHFNGETVQYLELSSDSLGTSGLPENPGHWRMALPLIVDVEGGASGREVWRRIDAGLEEMQQWNHATGWQGLVDAFANRPVSGWQSGVTWRSHTGEKDDDGRYGSLKITPYAIRYQRCAECLRVDWLGGSELCLTYQTDIYRTETIEQVAENFTRILTALARNPDTAVSGLLSAPDSDAKDHSGSVSIRPDKSFERFERSAIEQSIPHRFVEMVNRYADKTAIQTRDASLSYHDLNAYANRAAHKLLSQDAGNTDRVALLFGQGTWMVVGMLAALKSGKLYVPLDASLPEHRLEQIIADARVSAIVTCSEWALLAKQFEVDQVVEVDHLHADMSDDNPGIEILPEQPAYMIYTSGSTGLPKGVVQNHRNVLHFISAYTNQLHIASDDRLTLLSSYSFDAAVMDIYGALLNGATLCPINLKEENVQLLGPRLVGLGVTIYHSTPTVYRYFSDALSSSCQLPSVRLVVLGGEAVYRKDFEAYKRIFDVTCLFVNLLGSTESSLSMLHVMNHQSEVKTATVPAGFPVEATELVLLNEQGEEVALFGEIGFKSAFVALEYWQRPEQSARTFSQSTQSGVRIYRTGDLGRRLPDGRIEFEGRQDFQLKIRGYRVELGEVEANLSEHTGIDKCAVVAARDEQGEPLLTAYFRPRSLQQMLTVGEIREYLASRLPDYMMPGAYEQVDHFPMTPTGKIDRKALSSRLPV